MSQLADRAPLWRQLRVRLAVAIWRHGWAWPLASGLLTAALALHVTAVRDAHDQLRQAQRDLAAAHSGDGAAPPPPAVPDGLLRIHAARAAVQAAPGATEQVARMVRLAEAQQIALPQGDYLYQTSAAGTTTLAPTAQARVTHVQVTQPLRASYAHIRSYAEAVLNGAPYMALDQIMVQRDGVEQAQVEARLKWSLWVPSQRAPSPSGPLSGPPSGPATGNVPPRDLFAAHSWAPPPAPAPAPVMAAPVAPPLPYTYVGKKLENGEWEVYLARGEQTFAVRTGATLEAAYRVDTIAPPVMTLTYLPLAQTQNLSIGDHR